MGTSSEGLVLLRAAGGFANAAGLADASDRVGERGGTGRGTWTGSHQAHASVGRRTVQGERETRSDPRCSVEWKAVFPQIGHGGELSGGVLAG